MSGGTRQVAQGQRCLQAERETETGNEWATVQAQIRTCSTEQISPLDDDAKDLSVRSGSIKSRHTRLGVSDGPVNELMTISRWVEDELPELRRLQRLRDLTSVMAAGKRRVAQVADSVLSRLDEASDHPAHPIWGLQSQPGVPTVTRFYTATATAMVASDVDPTTWDTFRSTTLKGEG